MDLTTCAADSSFGGWSFSEQVMNGEDLLLLRRGDVLWEDDVRTELCDYSDSTMIIQ